MLPQRSPAISSEDGKLRKFLLLKILIHFSGSTYCLPLLFQIGNLKKKLLENRSQLNQQLTDLKESGDKKSDQIRDLGQKLRELEQSDRFESAKMDERVKLLDRLTREKCNSGEILKAIGIDREAVLSENVRRGRERDELVAKVAEQVSESEILTNRLTQLNGRREALQSQLETLRASSEPKLSGLHQEIEMRSADFDVPLKEHKEFNERLVFLSFFLSTCTSAPRSI